VIRIFTDPSWLAVFIAVLQSIAGGSINLILQLSKRQRMTSVLKINRPVLRLDKTIKNDCEVTFKGQEVTNSIYMLTLAIKNTGSQAIQLHEYANNTKIEIKFGDNAKVLDIAIDKKFLGRANAQLGTNNVTIDPLDLNPRDTIIVYVSVATDFDGEITEATRVLNTEQVLKVTVPSQPTLINNIVSLFFLILPLLSFFLVTYYTWNSVFQAPPINDETNQALAISVCIAGLVATLCSIGIFFAIHHIRPVSMSSKQYSLKISSARNIFATNNVISAFLLFVFPQFIFFFSKIFIMNNIFSFVPPIDPATARSIDYSVLIGGLITTLLLVIINFVLGTWFPLREFDPN
jgi:hypothetical protein